MHPHQAAFFQFRAITQSLGELSEAQQILTLKFELLHALELAHDFQNRSRALQFELRALRWLRREDHEATCEGLHRQLHDARRELASAKADGQHQLRAMRLKLLAMETRCQTLDEICRSLLVTIEQAASLESATSAPTVRDVGASA